VAPPRRPSVLFDLFVASQLTGQLLELELAGSGIPANDFAMYSALAHHGEVTPSALAGELGMPLSTVLFRFARIEQRGHGSRGPNPRDRRSSLLALTPTGSRLVDEVAPRFRDTLLAVHEHLSLPSESVRDAVADVAAAIAAALAAARDRELLARRSA
jgi:DNA-binding MarR family transcriptional regulator